MNELINEFNKLSLTIDNNSIQSLTQQFQNINLEDPGENEINQLENMFTNLNLQNNEQFVHKFLEFIMILRKKAPCRVYTDLKTAHNPTKCH